MLVLWHFYLYCLLFANSFFLLEFAENRKLEASYHFYSYFGYELFSYSFFNIFIFMHHSGKSTDIIIIFHIFKKYIRTKWKISSKTFLECSHEFPMTDPFTSYISFRKRILRY